MCWLKENTTPIIPREVTEDVENDALTRVLAAAIHVADHLELGIRDLGPIRPTTTRRRRLQTVIDEEHEAKSVRGRAAAAAGWVRSATSFLRGRLRSKPD